MQGFIILLVASQIAVAAVNLRVPLVYEDCVKKNGKTVCTTRLLSTLNAALKKKNITSSLYDAFPDFIEIESGTDVSEEYMGVDELVDAASKGLKKDIELSRYNSVSTYTNSKLAHPLCYVGLKSEDSSKRWAHAQAVVGFIRALAYDVFSDQLQVLGWKYRQNKELRKDIESADEAAFPELWREWRGTGEAILVVNVDDDDGNLFSADIVKRCP